MAALIVIALVAAAFVTVFVSAALASQNNERRTTATQLGQQRLETVVSQPWVDVGLFPTDANYQAAANGEPTVNLPFGPHLTSIPNPLDTSIIKRTSYSVRTDVTWRDDPADGLAASDRNGSTEDIKHISITVSWTVGSNTRTVSFDGLRSANASDVPPASSATGLGVSVIAPSSQQITSAGLFLAPMTITAKASRTTTSAVLAYSTRGSATPTKVAMTSVDGGVNWSATLGTTTGPFDTGNVTFGVTVTAGTASASSSAVVQMTTGSAIVNVSAAPSQQLATSYALSSSITVQVTSPTAIQSGTVSYPTRNSGTVSRVLTGSGTSWSYTVPVDAVTYNVGTEIFSVSVVFADSTSGTGTGSLLLDDPNLPPDVTAVTVNDQYSATTPMQSFCVNSKTSALWNATTIDARVSNVATTDQVTINAPAYTGTSYYAMTYLSTNTDGSRMFRLTVAAGTVFPGGTIDLKVHAQKTINGSTIADDFFTAPVSIQPQAKSNACL